MLVSEVVEAVFLNKKKEPLLCNLLTVDQRMRVDLQPRPKGNRMEYCNLTDNGLYRRGQCCVAMQDWYIQSCCTSEEKVKCKIKEKFKL